jgi:carboxymethylenebutenolidase
MASSTVTIGTETQKGYLAVPASGSGPAVVVLQEWWGLVKHIQDVCDRFAAEGFVALAPDLYHGETATGPDEAGRLMMALQIDRAADDLLASVSFLKHHDATSRNRVGVIGFCMGGQLALYAASLSPDIGACVDFYGLHSEVKPNYMNIECPVLGIFGENDEYVTPEAAEQMEADLKMCKVEAEFMVFEGCDHAFCNDSRPDVYNKDAAKLALKITQDFLREHL